MGWGGAAPEDFADGEGGVEEAGDSFADGDEADFMYVYIYLFIYVFMYVFICWFMYSFMYLFVDLCIHLCIYLCIYLCIHLCIYVSIYLFMYVLIHLCIYYVFNYVFIFVFYIFVLFEGFDDADFDESFSSFDGGRLVDEAEMVEWGVGQGAGRCRVPSGAQRRAASLFGFDGFLPRKTNKYIYN